MFRLLILLVTILFGALRVVLRSRSDLFLENVALRQQLEALKRRRLRLTGERLICTGGAGGGVTVSVAVALRPRSTLRLARPLRAHTLSGPDTTVRIGQIMHGRFWGIQ